MNRDWGALMDGYDYEMGISCRGGQEGEGLVSTRLINMQLGNVSALSFLLCISCISFRRQDITDGAQTQNSHGDGGDGSSENSNSPASPDVTLFIKITRLFLLNSFRLFIWITRLDFAPAKLNSKS